MYSNIKSSLISLLKLCIDLISRLKFFAYLYFKASKYKDLYIFDLDNTIADTWPYFYTFKSKKLLFQSIPDFPSMIKLVKEVNTKSLVCVLSARPFYYRSITKKWLSKRGLDLKVFLVPEAKNKIQFLKLCAKYDIQVHYYDDLSFNQENGKIKFYTEIIEKITDFNNVIYYDYFQIKLIQEQ